MVQLRARKSLMFLAAALLIVLAAATIVAPRLVTNHQTDYMLERVTVTPKEEAGVPQPQHVIVAHAKMSGSAASVAVVRNASSGSHASLATPLIARTAAIGMLAGNVDQVIEQVDRLARASNGVVFSLETQNDNAPDSNASADMSIRVPASRFDETIAALARFGSVTSRSVKAEDLTGDITDSGARLTNLRRTEADIRAIMDRSGSVSDIMDAENKLSDIREQIETIESDLKSMNGRVAYSSIDVHLAAETQNKPADPSIANQLGNAFGSASHALVQSVVSIATKAIWLLVFYAPYPLLVAAIAWFVRLRLRKNAIGG